MTTDVIENTLVTRVFFIYEIRDVSMTRINTVISGFFEFLLQRVLWLHETI